MTAPNFIQKSENMLLSSLGSAFTHGLVNPDGTSCTPAGSFGETRIFLRSAGAASGAFISLSNSVFVTVQSLGGNAVTADVICQRYHSIIA
jgi:hypothetical protein